MIYLKKISVVGAVFLGLIPGLVSAGIYDTRPDIIVYQCDAFTATHVLTFIGFIGFVDDEGGNLNSTNYNLPTGSGGEIAFDNAGNVSAVGGLASCDTPPTTLAEFQQYDLGDFASTSTATTSMEIVNPTQDMFNGIMLFLLVALFFVWFFRRPYDTY